MSLRALLAEYTRNCPHVGHAWVAPNDTAFAIQGVVGRKAGPDPDHKGWTRIEPAYLGPEAMRELHAIARKVQQRYPDALEYVVPYVFRPGASWIEVYPRGALEAA